MLNDIRDAQLEAKAKALYSDELPYHNFSHILDTLNSAGIILTRCVRENIRIDARAVYFALLFHDAGYHEDHAAKGYKNKELYSVKLAQEILRERFNVAADVWSATSYNELYRDALDAERHNRLNPDKKPRVPYLTAALRGAEYPIIATSDYVRAVPGRLSPWAPAGLLALGTDGYGRSDSRAALRQHFEVDRRYITVAALKALADEGMLDQKTVAQAIEKFGIDPEKPDPVTL